MTRCLARFLSPWLLLAVSATAMAAQDLSKYRNFRLGSDLAAIAKQAAASPSQAKVIHSRPALLQDLEWHPQPLGSAAQVEPVKDVTFSFCNSVLYRIAVNYDRYATEGMTAADLIDAISAEYGAATKPSQGAAVAAGRYGDAEEAVAQWRNSDYSFVLIRSAYGPSFKLVGALRALEATAQAASLEASQLDEKEAPQREAQRLAAENESARAKLEKARLLNKPKFRI